MNQVHPEYIIDEKGQKTSVLLPIGEWEAIQEELEELDDIKVYDDAKNKDSDPIPFDSK